MSNGFDPLSSIFSPQSIAVVGVSRKESSIGRAILKNIIDYGFEGTVYPVNPKAKFVNSIKCYPDLRALPEKVELVVITVPAPYVKGVMQDAADLGVKGIIVISAGFKEIGNKGELLENQLHTIAKTAGIRVVGPNCMGILHAHSPFVNATFAPGTPLKGRIGFISQSGALGVVVLDYAKELGIGFSKFISLGNKMDINATIMLQNLGNDENTKVILAYLESFSDPWNFFEVTSNTTRKKPVIMVKSGRTAAGARAATSHTGALATTETVLTATLSGSGVIRVSTVEELFDCATAFDKLPLPQGNRVGILTNAGGPGTLAVDSLVGYGLEVMELSLNTQKDLKTFLPEEASVVNPVDMIASAGPEQYRKGIEVLLKDPLVDMLLVIFVPPLMIAALEIVRIIDEMMKKSSKPIFGCIMGRNQILKQGLELSFPLYLFPESAALAIRAMYAYQTYLSTPISEYHPVVDVDETVKYIVRDAIKQGQHNLKLEQVKQLFEAYGFTFPESSTILSAEELIQASRNMQYPLVLKMATQKVDHKTDEGGVIVDIRSEGELLTAWQRIHDSYDRLGLGEFDRQIVVQHYYSDGVEMALGASLDPQFGPMVAVGTGGVLVEILEDIVFERVPVSKEKVRMMIRKLKGYPLLLGYRGDNPVCLKKLELSILKLSQMVYENREIREIDINPLLVLEPGYEPIVLDARVSF
ncbi:MAG: acetate--CoA ligase family protein [Candidatus Heimdallarchaeota archaeon]|nr:acetate--CoA ligase family protein [Candidatus Heimdallarchaeota archaeon]